MISFLSESFIFCYIGVSVFVSDAHKWNFFFLLFALVRGSKTYKHVPTLGNLIREKNERFSVLHHRGTCLSRVPLERSSEHAQEAENLRQLPTHDHVLR